MGACPARTFAAEVEELVTRLRVVGRVVWKQNAKGEFVVAVVLAPNGIEQFVAYDHGGQGSRPEGARGRRKGVVVAVCSLPVLRGQAAELSFHRDHPRPSGKALLIELQPGHRVGESTHNHTMIFGSGSPPKALTIEQALACGAARVVGGGQS